MGEQEGGGGQPNPFRQAAAARRRKIQHAAAVRFDHRVLAILRAGFITNPETPDLAEYAQELADQSGREVAVCLAYLKRHARNEMWTEHRKRYWIRLQERALERDAQRTLATFERRQQALAGQMLDIGEEALLRIPVTSITEAILLLKLGSELGYRALRAPSAVRHFYDEDGQIVKPPIEASFQSMPEDDYAAATEADLAQLAPQVGPGPAPGGDHA